MFFEVRNRTGYGGQVRTADALAMSLYPSRGIELIGIEIKTSRSDWVKEMKEPAKAEAICRYCDRWYIFAGGKDIVRDGELPPNWGLMIPRGKHFVCVQSAPQLSPEPVSREFLASIFRTAVECSATEAALKAARSTGYDDACNDRKQDSEIASSGYKREAARLVSVITDFEESSGVKIWRYGGGRIGEQVKAYYEIKGFGASKIKYHRDVLADLVESFDKCLSSLADTKSAQDDK